MVGVYGGTPVLQVRAPANGLATPGNVHVSVRQ